MGSNLSIKPTPPRYRCRVVFDKTYRRWNVVQITPGGRNCAISKRYFTDVAKVNKYAGQLTWAKAVELCRRANLDRLDRIFTVSRTVINLQQVNVDS